MSGTCRAKPHSANPATYKKKRPRSYYLIQKKAITSQSLSKYDSKRMQGPIPSSQQNLAVQHVFLAL